MTLPQIISRNQLQKIPTIQISRNDVAAHPITYYTCPTGKKAIIKGKATCENTGAAAVVDIIVNSISICEWQATGGVFDPNVPQDLAEGTQFPFEVQLEAGETMVSAQDSGTNAEIKMFAEVTETPV